MERSVVALECFRQLGRDRPRRYPAGRTGRRAGAGGDLRAGIGGGCDEAQGRCGVLGAIRGVD